MVHGNCQLRRIRCLKTSLIHAINVWILVSWKVFLKANYRAYSRNTACKTDRKYIELCPKRLIQILSFNKIQRKLCFTLLMRTLQTVMLFIVVC